MREVAIVAFAQTPSVASSDLDEAEMVQVVTQDALNQLGITQRDIGFTCSGSCDMLIGRPFSFVSALDGLAAWPPIQESHVEMDGAWALYESFVRLQHGDIDTALVYAFGRSSAGDVADVLTLQLDPYYLGPLWPDAHSVAALQARALLDSGKATESDFAEVAARNLLSAQSNKNAQVSGSFAPT
ncbi:MAG: lipid-transfer protein, partial [Myxococcales bacterium]|nr:lipid-transfer protein [Myxococcales bacterium]